MSLTSHYIVKAKSSDPNVPKQSLVQSDWHHADAVAAAETKWSHFFLKNRDEFNPRPKRGLITSSSVGLFNWPFINRLPECRENTKSSNRLWLPTLSHHLHKIFFTTKFYFVEIQFGTLGVRGRWEQQRWTHSLLLYYFSQKIVLESLESLYCMHAV